MSTYSNNLYYFCTFNIQVYCADNCTDYLCKIKVYNKRKL